MASAETIISNARAYADSAVSGAIMWIQTLMALEDLVNNIQFVDGVPIWSYEKISDEASHALNVVTSQKPQMPPKLGDYEDITPPEVPEPFDYAGITDLINEIIEMIKGIPDLSDEIALLFNSLSSVILTALQNGDYGISPTEEQALWDRARDREADAIEKATAELRKQYAGFGLPIPQGAMTSALQELLNASQNRMNEVNRDVLLKRADLYRASREFMIKSGIELASSQSNFMKMKVEMFNGAINGFLEILKVKLAEYGYLLNVFTSRVQLIIEEQKTLSEIYRTDITGWAARMDALMKACGVAQQANADQWQADKLVASESINRAQAQISAYGLEVNTRVAAMKSIADVLQNKVAGALSGLNTLVAQIETLEAAP